MTSNPSPTTDPTALDLHELIERLRATTEFNPRGPNYEPMLVPPGELRLEAAAQIGRLLDRIEGLEGENGRLKTPKRDAMIERSEDEWDAVQDAIATVYSFKEGHTLSADDVAALHLVDKYQREDEEAATDAYHSGREEGLRERGGDELVRLDKRVSDLITEKATESFMRKFAEADNARLRGALEKLSLASDQVNGEIDRQTYDDKVREFNFDVPLDHQWSVSLSQADVHALNRAICDAQTLIRSALSQDHALSTPRDDEGGHSPSVAESAAVGTLPALPSTPVSAGRRSGIYVASRASVLARGEMWRKHRAAGAPIISTWIDEDGPNDTADLDELWVRIRREVVGAELLVLYVEPDDFPLKGAFVEIGMALAANVPIRIVAPDVEIKDRNCRPFGSWIRHPSVSFWDDVGSALNPDPPNVGRKRPDWSR